MIRSTVLTDGADTFPGSSPASGPPSTRPRPPLLVLPIRSAHAHAVPPISGPQGGYGVLGAARQRRPHPVLALRSPCSLSSCQARLLLPCNVRLVISYQAGQPTANLGRREVHIFIHLARRPWPETPAARTVACPGYRVDPGRAGARWPRGMGREVEGTSLQLERAVLNINT